jgi:hypothetical protein
LVVNMASVLAVPGIQRVTLRFLAMLVAIAQRNGWNVDGLAAIISHESGFRPDIRNPTPGQTATGLIQFIESTARRLGTTTADLARMTAEQQLPFVEKFFVMTLQGRKPTDPADYILAPYGRPDLQGKPDATVVDRRDSDNAAEAMRYRVNAGLDAAKKGFITAGDLRASLRRTIAAAGGRRVEVPPGALGAPSSGEGGFADLVVVGVLGAAALGFGWLLLHGGIR